MTCQNECHWNQEVYTLTTEYIVLKMAIHAPKQLTLTENETITSLEAWRQNLQFTLSLDATFASFLVEDSTWLKKTSTSPLRGFTDDQEPITEAYSGTKINSSRVNALSIANYCPIISRSLIVKSSTSVNQIWQAIRLHFGFQSCGLHFLDFNNIHLEPVERPEDLYQRINTCSFVKDNLLKTNGSISHQGDIPASDEEGSSVAQW